MQRTFTIEGMRCQSCVARVTLAAEAIAEVDAAKVTLEPPVLTVDFDGNENQLAERLRSAVESAGDYQLASKPANAGTQRQHPKKRGLATYQPLLLIVGFLLLACTLLQWRNRIWQGREFAADFMGGFFLTFAFFKLLDWKGFAKSFAMYDLIAARFRGYAMAYPIIELVLGCAYILRWRPTLTNAITLGLMIVGGLGVGIAVAQRQKIQCACLGTVFDLPMSLVTVIENGTMAAMALMMIAA